MKVATLGKNRRLTQSWSVARFVPFIIEQWTEDDLPRHIRGAAIWNEVHNEEGYFLFDPLSHSYQVVEYQKDDWQWYFIQQDTKTSDWQGYNPCYPWCLERAQEHLYQTRNDWDMIIFVTVTEPFAWLRPMGVRGEPTT